MIKKTNLNKGSIKNKINQTPTIELAVLTQTL